jgi:hypothetical protein
MAMGCGRVDLMVRRRCRVRHVEDLGECDLCVKIYEPIASGITKFHLSDSKMLRLLLYAFSSSAARHLTSTLAELAWVAPGS